MSLDGYGLAPQQRREWALRQYNLPAGPLIVIRLRGPLERDRLRMALHDIVRKNEVLRTTFCLPPSMSAPVQVVHSFLAPEWNEYDLTCSKETERPSRIQTLIQAETSRTFDYEAGPLLRAAIVKNGPAEHVLVLSAAALCADGPTMARIYSSLGRVCAPQAANCANDDSSIQYADLAVWLESACQAQSSGAAAYWAKFNILASLKRRPAWFRREPVPKPERQKVEFAFGASELEALQITAGRLEAALEVLLLAAWQTVLGRATGFTDLVVGVASSGRTEPQLENTAGPLAQLFPAVCTFAPEMRFEQAVWQAERAVTEAFSLLEFGAGRLPGELDQMCFPFGFEFVTEPDPYQAEKLEFSVLEYVDRVDRADLVFFAHVRAKSLACGLSFYEGALDAETVAALSAAVERFIRAVMKDPALRADIPNLITGGDRQRLSRTSIGAIKQQPGRACVHQLFEDQVARTPHRPAVKSGERVLTYSELNGRANLLATRLRQTGIGPEILVGIFASDAVDFATAVWGVLKSGAAFVPLDPRTANDRTRCQIEDAHLRAIISDGEHLKSLQNIAAAEVILLSSLDSISSFPPNLQNLSEPANIAYVIYTSGSTGSSKGVCVTQQGLVNYSLALCDRMGEHASSGLVFGSMSTVSADLGNTAFFPCFLCGGCLHMIGYEIAIDAPRLGAYLEANGVDILKAVPSHFDALLGSAGAQALLPKVHLILGGEKLSEDLYHRIRSLSSLCSVSNHYGPTETTIGSLMYTIPDRDPLPYQSKSVPIGRPLPNTNAYVTDEQGRLEGLGAPGELYIGGMGLARGYLNQPGLTAERFLPDPFADRPGARCYRTGDIVRRLPDGTIEFIGRSDDQLKIRGNRVETSEIEVALRGHPSVMQAAVIGCEIRGPEKQLVAYVARKKAEPSANVPSLYTLSDGIHVFHHHAHETDFFARQIFVDNPMERYGMTLREGDTVFDVGANIGLFTLFAHRQATNIRVFAFEPVPETFAVLRENVRLHGIRAELFACGLSDREQDTVFTFYPNESCMSGCYSDAGYDRDTLRTILQNQSSISKSSAAFDALVEHRMESRQIQCRLTTLSKIIADWNIDRIDLLKIDVEKSELDVLRGLADRDWPRIKQIVIEAHRAQARLDEILALLDRHGYRHFVEQDPALKDTDIYNVVAARNSTLKLQFRERPEIPRHAIPRHAFNRDGANLTAELRRHLQSKLPDYMVPRAFVFLDALPFTPNGKLDRAALPVPAPSASGSDEPPCTPTEFKLAAIWAELLGRESVTRNANFFEMGGDSIIAIQVVARAAQAGIRITPPQLFEHQTIAGVGGVAEATIKNGRIGAETGYAPLTPIQHWFFEQEIPERHHWNQAVILVSPAEICWRDLNTAFQLLYDHHSALRLRFLPDAGSYLMQIGASQTVPFARINLIGLSADARKRAIEESSAALQRSLSLPQGPLTRIAYFDGGPNDKRLLIIVHHLAIDGVSWRILLDDLRLATGRPGVPIELTPSAPFLDWARRLPSLAASSEIVAESNYWCSLAIPEAQLPVENARGRNTVASSRTVSVSLDELETDALLRRLPTAYDAQIQDLLLTALSAAIGFWTGRPETAVMTEGHGRESIVADLDVSRTVGWFTAMFPVMLTSHAQAPPSAKVDATKRMLRAVPRRGFGYGLLRYLHPDPAIRQTLREKPQPGISFNYLGQADNLFTQGGSFAPASENAGAVQDRNGLRAYLLAFDALVFGGRFRLDVTYSANLHGESTAELLAHAFLAALRELIHAADALDPGDCADFSEADLSAEELDRLVANLARGK